MAVHIKTVINFHLARIGSRKLQTISAGERAAAVNTLADLLTSKQHQILDANATDLAEATKAGLAKPLLSRLSLSAGKLNNLATGLRQIADSSHRVSFVLSPLHYSPPLSSATDSFTTLLYFHHFPHFAFRPLDAF